jgi:hypothetical protein
MKGQIYRLHDRTYLGTVPAGHHRTALASIRPIRPSYFIGSKHPPRPAIRQGEGGLFLFCSRITASTSKRPVRYRDLSSFCDAACLALRPCDPACPAPAQPSERRRLCPTRSGGRLALKLLHAWNNHDDSYKVLSLNLGCIW